MLFLIAACGSNDPQVPPSDHDYGGAAAGAGPKAGGGVASGGGSSGTSGGIGARSGAGGAPSGGSGAASNPACTASGAAGSGGADPSKAPAAGAANAGSAACESSAGCASIEQTCLASAADACERCLCTDCAEAVRRCGETSGCPEILSCIREHRCEGVSCYCGTFDAIACAAGRSNGPCKSAILEAPAASEPTLLNPSAGPASDAALAIADCAQPGRPCADECPMIPES